MSAHRSVSSSRIQVEANRTTPYLGDYTSGFNARHYFDEDIFVIMTHEYRVRNITSLGIGVGST